MQFTTLSVAFFAALASAHNLQQAAQHFHPRRHLNSTSTNSGESATLTLFSTQIRTITGCVASVTDCPARSSGGLVVTDTIAVTTVGGVDSTPSAPLGTGITPAPSATGLGSGEEAQPSSEAVLTYTLGTGSSTTVITTTIKHTSTATVYVWVEL